MFWIVFAAAVSASSACIAPCADGVCAGGRRASLVVDGECVFDATVRGRDVFYTGHVFGLGVCAAVQKQVSRDCYRAMASVVAEGLRGAPVGNETVACLTHVHNTPCALGEHKWSVESVTRAGTCADLKLMYEDAMEECLREEQDARFWLSFLYVLGVIVVLGALGALCGGTCCSMSR